MAPPVLDILFPKLCLILSKRGGEAITEFQKGEVFGCKKGAQNCAPLDCHIVYALSRQRSPSRPLDHLDERLSCWNRHLRLFRRYLQH